jgi:hypothetical protein
MADLDEVFLPPNGGAYEKRETRTGPPLEYVAEKLVGSIRSIHEGLAKQRPEDRASPLRAALQQGVTAFLALHNMLALAHAHDWFDRIESMSRSEFRLWTERVGASGSVSG